VGAWDAGPADSGGLSRKDVMGKRLAATRPTVAAATAIGVVFGLGGLVMAGTADAAVAYVATSAVNVRSEPTASSDIVGILKLGQNISGGSPAQGWVPVTYDGATRYVYADYLRLSEVKPAVSTSPSASASARPSSTASASASAKPGNTASASASAKPSSTTSASPSAKASDSPSAKASASPSASGSANPTATPSVQAATVDTTATTDPRQMVTTVNVNLRSGPSLDDAIITVLPKGTKVNATGKTSGKFTEVDHGGALRWLYTDYLKAVTTDAEPSLPAIKYEATTTALLALRVKPEITAKSLADLAAGSKVAMTGTHKGSYSQIVWKKQVVWVLSGYLTTEAGPAVPTLPVATGKLYSNVNELNIRAGSAADARIVDTVRKGTVLLTTGRKENSRTQVIYNGALRWAYSAYLSKTRPDTDTTYPTDGPSLGSASLDRTNAYAKAIVREVRELFPAIKTIYGWRTYSAYSSDHPKGRALDIMIPSWQKSSGKALGDALASHLQRNYKRLHVRYLIWKQRNWNVERNLNFVTGWRKMADRGGYTANHYDHVHVSVYDVKK
jgi:uncharacterized protein YgiM (DUF1202 family)